MKFFSDTEPLYQWKTSHYLVDFIFTSEQKFVARVKQNDRIVAQILESDINGLDVAKLRKLNLSNIKKALAAHFPLVSQYSDGAFRLSFSASGLGGWVQKIHEEMTMKWCLEMGMRHVDAKLVGERCQKVDTGKRDPVLHPFDYDAQKWHFNKNADPNTGDGDPFDTRIILAVDQLNAAIEKRLPTELGKGLHPLQDLFAHISKFVSEWPVPKPCHHHLLHMEADDPKFINARDDSPLSLDLEDRKFGFSQRYTNTRLLTQYYVKCYLDGRKTTHADFSRIVKEALALSHHHHRRTPVDLARAFGEFKRKLNLHPEDELDQVNAELAKMMQF